MAHPILWPKKTFFYPIGNTPPICLTQDLAPEENAEILLLGCGDPRSILYTVHSDLIGSRRLDLTCCDWEPAILARNVLLLTMIIDGVPSLNAWRIFYHFFLDDASHDVLLAQCQTLIQSSSDSDKWNTSKYGAYLRFCTDYSLAEMRRHWQLYLETDTLPKREKDALRDSFVSGMKSIRDQHSGHVVSCLRAAGPLVFFILPEGPKSYTSYWTTGITTSKSSKTTSFSRVNPTFAYSVAGRKFNVHYGTDPILAFHLAPALTSVKGTSSPSRVTAQDLVESAMKQFSTWCSSFQRRIARGSSANIVIRFFSGECLAFCQAIRVRREGKLTKTGFYTYPWGLSQIDLSSADYATSSSSAAPLLFNVIETSNLIDHVGLLNLLTVAVPLLQPKPWSVIHTNTLVRADPRGPASSGLVDKACADLPTLALLLGVAPSSHLSHFTTHSNKHELIASSLMSGQFHESISWRFPSSAVPCSPSAISKSEKERPLLVCDEQKLAGFFFSVYLKMFTDENMRENLQNVNAARLQKQNLVHYLRASFASFLSLAKERVDANWEMVMKHLMSLIWSDLTLMLGPNNYQDLACQLYLRNIYAVGTLRPGFVESVRGPYDRFHGWKDVPPVVCIVLKVPRHHIKVLEDMHPDEIMVPILQCESTSPNFHNMHSFIRPVLGNVEVSHVAGEQQVVIHEDPKGWDGNSPLIVTFYMNSWILTQAPKTTRIVLSIRSTPAITPALISKLGMMLEIYSTSLMDADHICVVRRRPGNIGEIDRMRNSPVRIEGDSVPPRKVSVGFDASGAKATSLTIRDNITDPQAAKSLSSGAAVSSEPVADCVLRVSYEGYERLFSYPFPIRGKGCKTRIARKSSYIEIESSMRSDFDDFLDFSLNPFPIARVNDSLNLLNVHYLNLNVLPALRLPMPAKELSWLSTHIGLSLSEREKEVKKRDNQEDRGLLINLKESIATFFIKWSGLDAEHTRTERNSLHRRIDVFGLSHPDEGVYTLIFINDIKLDLSSHTVVVDACVIPLTQSLITKLTPVLQYVTARGMQQIFTLDDETRAWKLLLPVLAERCRTWKHSATCEYCKKGVPASVEGFDYSPLCSCGKGKNLGALGTIPEWKLARPEATRIAIGPLFTFSFMEKSMKKMMESIDKEDKDTKASPQQPGASSSAQCTNCSGPGNPTLLACSVCKTTKYCSSACQKSHWKIHKRQCGKINS